MQPVNPRGDAPAVDGPDYVAVLIEWDEQTEPEDVANLAGDTLGLGDQPVLPPPRSASLRAAAAVLGALGLIALGWWGLRRLRA